jgi:L-rhamnose-H+ transport protein
MNPFAGIALIALGSIGAASFYVPFKKVRNWAWESYWIVQGLVAWIIAPWVAAWLSVPAGTLGSILSASPSSAKLWAAFYGVLWGIGSLTFGLSIRYLGVALGQSIALGLCAAFGTLLPPILAGENLFSTPCGILTVIGVSVCVLGIVIIGYAGALKNKGMSVEERQAAEGICPEERLSIAFAARSACFNFGYREAHRGRCTHHGWILFQKNPSLIFILLGRIHHESGVLCVP